MPDQDDELQNVDAGTFQKPLVKLAEVLAQKVKREAPGMIAAPDHVFVDLHVLVRQAMNTYDLLFYMNADERRETDCYYRTGYSIALLPLVRTMIDCLYNVTAILERPRENGTLFRKSGFRKRLEALAEDERAYGGQPKWDDWIKRNRDGVLFRMRGDGLDIADVMASPSWPTMGKYVSDRQPGGTLSGHQQFLKTFTYGKWREYSAISHGAFEGLMQVALYYITDSFPHENRQKVDELFPRVLSLHLGRAAIILLSIVTELQHRFRFEGADIDNRIRKMWDALCPIFEAKEIYDQRYSKMLKAAAKAVY
jgi:hypothetical protein